VWPSTSPISTVVCRAGSRAGAAVAAKGDACVRGAADVSPEGGASGGGGRLEIIVASALGSGRGAGGGSGAAGGSAAGAGVTALICVRSSLALIAAVRPLNLDRDHGDVVGRAALECRVDQGGHRLLERLLQPG